MRHAVRSRASIFVTLLVASLVVAGCGSTKTVGPDGSPHRAEINEEAEENTAKVTLRDGEKLKLKNFRIEGDSASGMTDVHTVSLATSRIDQVKFTNRRRTALKWGGGVLGLGAVSGSLIPLLDSGTSTSNFGTYLQLGLGYGAALSLPTGVTAALSGNSDVYDFEKSPSLQEPQVPAEEKKRVIARNETKASSESTSPTEEESGALSIVDTQVPQTSMRRPDDIAVVIGSKEYTNDDIPNVDYAVRDAQVTKKYLTRTLGFREENIIYVENPSGSAMRRIFGTDDSPEAQLYNWVKPEESNVFVYYSGHGAPNPETGNAYLLPSDTNPSYLSQNGYPLNQLYENLSKVPAQSVTVVLEACFSGTSEGGAVVQNASPAVLSVENPIMGMEQGLALTAGATDQIASWYPEKRHGLFTYYFLKGLRGNADQNSDQAITAEEMEAYLGKNVPYSARRMHNREQIPQVVGQNKDRVLVRYEETVPAGGQR